MALNDYLTEVITPNVDNLQFSNDLQDMVNTINNNFKKLISAPFLKGDKGNNVLLKQESIYEPNSDVFTEFGATLVNTIYGPGTISQGQIYGDLVSALNDQLGTGKPSCAQLDPSDTNNKLYIDIFYDIYDQSKTMSTLYMFLDGRLNLLESIPDENKIDFIDQSCAVYGKFEGSAWNLVKNNVFPTLYYNSIAGTTSEGEFCWSINGQRTGITAQGVKGDAGTDAKIIIAKGYEDWAMTWDGENVATRIKINEIISPKGTPLTPNINGSLALVWFDTNFFDYCDPNDIDISGNVISDPDTREEGYKFIAKTTTGTFIEKHIYEWVLVDPQTQSHTWEDKGEIRKNQVVKMWNNSPSTLNDYTWEYLNKYGVFVPLQSLNPIIPFINPNAAFGIVNSLNYNDNDIFYIDYERDQDLGRIVSNLSMRKLLNSTGYTGYTSEGGVRGIYLRGESISSGNVNNPNNNEIIHLAYGKNYPNSIWGNNYELNIVPTKYENTEQSKSDPTIDTGIYDTNTLNLKYHQTNLGYDTNYKTPHVNINEVSGVVIKNKDRSDNSFINTLITNPSLSTELGRMQFKLLEPTKKQSGVLSFIPFTDIEVKVGVVDSQVLSKGKLIFKNPSLAYISDNNNDNPSKGINPNDNDKTYDLIETTSFSIESGDMSVDFPFDNIFYASTNGSNNISTSNYYIIQTSYKDPRDGETKTGSLKCWFRIQNVGLRDTEQKSADSRRVFIVEYNITPPQNQANHPDNELYNLISHEELSDSQEYDRSCTLRFFLVCNPFYSNVIIDYKSKKINIYPFDTSYLSIFYHDTPTDADSNHTWGYNHNCFKPMMKLSDQSGASYFFNATSRIYTIQLADIDNARTIFDKWSWAKRSSLGAPNSPASNIELWKDCYGSSDYTKIESYENGPSIETRDLGYSVYIYDCFASVLRPSSVLKTEYDTNYQYRTDYQNFGIEHIIGNDVKLTISLFPKNSYNELKLCLNTSNPNRRYYDVLKQQESEWLYINDQPIGISNNKITNNYENISFNDEQSSSDYTQKEITITTH